MGVVDPVTLPVSEVFGPTFQGEGPHTGTRCGFVRLGLCNLSCEWCDTPYTWDRSRYDVDAECPPTSVEDVHHRLRALGVDTVVLSGGEPLVHKATLRDLLVPAWTWHAETNGTIRPPAWWAERVQHTSISPKVNTRDPAKRRLRYGALEEWNALAAAGSAAFKFVASHPGDLHHVATVVDRVGIAPAHVWVMPEGRDVDALLARHRVLAPLVLARGWNTTTRLHTLLYGEERGR